MSQLVRFLPWYAGPDWPTAREHGWWWAAITVALLVLAAGCGAEAALWFTGRHSISWMAVRDPRVRGVVAVLIVVGFVVAEGAWLRHSGHYDGP